MRLLVNSNITLCTLAHGLKKTPHAGPPEEPRGGEEEGPRPQNTEAVSTFHQKKWHTTASSTPGRRTDGDGAAACRAAQPLAGRLAAAATLSTPRARHVT